MGNGIFHRTEYLPAQKIGLRKEEIVILRSDSPEILSYLPRDLTVID